MKIIIIAIVTAMLSSCTCYHYLQAPTGLLYNCVAIEKVMTGTEPAEEIPCIAYFEGRKLNNIYSIQLNCVPCQDYVPGRGYVLGMEPVDRPSLTVIH